MAATYKEGQVTIWKNDYKTADNHPEYRGGAMLDGQTYDIALWVGEAANGRKFMNGHIKLVVTKPPEPPKEDPKDDLPF